MSTINIDFFEAMQIADAALNIENLEADESITENALAEKWEISSSAFHEIVQAVFDLINLGISPITSEAYIGLSVENLWIVKKNITPQFIKATMDFIAEGKKIPSKPGSGYMKAVTVNGKPTYELTIKRKA